MAGQASLILLGVFGVFAIIGVPLAVSLVAASLAAVRADTHPATWCLFTYDEIPGKKVPDTVIFHAKGEEKDTEKEEVLAHKYCLT